MESYGVFCRTNKLASLTNQWNAKEGQGVREREGKDCLQREESYETSKLDDISTDAEKGLNKILYLFTISNKNTKLSIERNYLNRIKMSKEKP